MSLSAHSHLTTEGPAGDEGGKRKYELTGSHTESHNESPETRFVSLGSRKQLCLNEKLKAKGGDLDERCRDLLQGTPCKTRTSPKSLTLVMLKTARPSQLLLLGISGHWHSGLLRHTLTSHTDFPSPLEGVRSVSPQSWL